ncbi:MAG: hypothetical protein VX815_09670, partial [Gemmatimonadota bacterium]|nr:hypothetical protein [Gemmatimonadota bacterium]
VGDELGDASGGGGQMNSIQSVSGPATADQLYQIGRSWRELPSVIDRLNDLVGARMGAVLAQVYQASVVPEAIKPVAMPRRR